MGDGRDSAGGDAIVPLVQAQQPTSPASGLVGKNTLALRRTRHAMPAVAVAAAAARDVNCDDLDAFCAGELSDELQGQFPMHLAFCDICADVHEGRALEAELGDSEPIRKTCTRIRRAIRALEAASDADDAQKITRQAHTMRERLVELDARAPFDAAQRKVVTALRIEAALALVRAFVPKPYARERRVAHREIELWRVRGRVRKGG